MRTRQSALPRRFADRQPFPDEIAKARGRALEQRARSAASGVAKHDDVFHL
jgi:hypothetical protein